MNPNLKSKNKSEVWKYFSRKTNGLCICNLCSKTYKTGGGTTNLKNHLTHKHSLYFNKENKISRTSNFDLDKRSKIQVEIVGNNSKEKEQVTMHIHELLLNNM